MPEKGRTDAPKECLRNGRSWRSSPVSGPTGKGSKGADKTRSLPRRRTTPICALRTAGVDVNGPLRLAAVEVAVGPNRRLLHAFRERPQFAHCSRQGPALRRRSPRLAVNPSAEEPIGWQAPHPVQLAARSRLLACQTLSFSAAPLFAGSIASSWPASLAVSSMT